MDWSTIFLTALALYILTTVSLLILERSGNALAGFYGRSLAAWGSLILCALYGTIASAVLRVTGFAGLSQWTTAKSFKWTMRYTTDVRFDVADPNRWLETRPAVFVSNHQTELDVLMLGCVWPKYCSVTAKKSLMWMPFLGWFMLLSKTVFIDRGNRTNATAALDGAARTITEDRQSVYLFPEGTRSHTLKPELLPFKKGAFHLAIKAQVPIVPIVVANYSNVLHVKSKVFRAGRVPVQVLEPVPTKGLRPEDVDVLVTQVREKMLAELVQLTETARARGVANGEAVARVHAASAVKTR